MLNPAQRSATETYEGMICPDCGRSLLPILTEGSVFFHCKSGHELPLQRLLHSQTRPLRAALEKLAVDWGRQVEFLSRTADEARRNGFLEIAEIFYRQARAFEARIAPLRSSLIDAGGGQSPPAEERRVRPTAEDQHDPGSCP